MRLLKGGAPAVASSARPKTSSFSEALSAYVQGLEDSRGEHDPEDVVEELRVAEEHVREQLAVLERLQRSNHVALGRYDALFRTVKGPLLYTDRTGTIREANPAAEELVQRERRFLVGKPLASLIARDDAGAFRRLIDNLRAEAPCEGELEIRRHGGGLERVLMCANLTEAPHHILWQAQRLQLGVSRRVHRSGTYRAPAGTRASPELAARIGEELDRSLHDALACVQRLVGGRSDDGACAGLRLEKLLRTNVALAADLIELARVEEGGARASSERGSTCPRSSS
ncbi:MAG: PAS domain-containing protein [Myxococcales bacterium]|nr:PAS domain-containing protein [Myxococcales bacterium]